MRQRFFQLAVVAASLVLGLAEIKAGVVSFGSGTNQFQIEFVTIGNPGNAADTTGAPNPAGAVGYTYGIGKFEVSENMITKFNASQSLQITKDTRGPNNHRDERHLERSGPICQLAQHQHGGIASATKSEPHNMASII